MGFVILFFWFGIFLLEGFMVILLYLIEVPKVSQEGFYKKFLGGLMGCRVLLEAF